MGRTLVVIVGTLALFYVCYWLAEVTNPPAAAAPAAAAPAAPAAPAAATAPAPAHSAAH